MDELLRSRFWKRFFWWVVLCGIMLGLTVISLPGYALTVQTVAGAEEINSQQVEVEVQRFGMAVEASVETIAGPSSGKVGETFQFDLSPRALDQRLHLKIQVPDGTFYRELRAEELEDQRYRLTVPPYREQGKVSVSDHTVFVQPHRNQLIVREMLVVNNPSDVLTGGKGSLWIDLPEQSQRITPRIGFSESDELRSHPNGVSYTPLIPPGKTKIGFFYLVPLREGKLDYTKEVPVPTRRISFTFPSPQRIRVQTEQLGKLSSADTGAQVYVRSNLAPGDEVGLSLEVTGEADVTPRQSPSAQTRQMGPGEGAQSERTVDWNNSKYVMLLGVCLVVLLFAGGYFYIQYRPTDDSPPGPSRSFLVEEIARLDRLYENENIPEEYYKKTRRRWKKAAGKVPDDE